MAIPDPRSVRRGSLAVKPTQSAFEDVTKDPAGHFRLHFYAAVFYLANHLYHLRNGDRHGLARTLETFPFLGRYLGELKERLPENVGWQASIAWWDRELEAWERGAESTLPLCRAFERREERIALILIGLVEEESRFGALFSALEERPGGRRPTLATVESVMVAAGAPSGVCARLLERGAVAAVDTDTPRSEWELRIPLPVWAAVRGESPVSEGGWYRLVMWEELPTPEHLSGGIDLDNLTGLFHERKARALVVRGTPGSDRMRVVGAAARLLGLNLLLIEQEGIKAAAGAPWLGVLASLAAALPVFQVDPLPGETQAIPALSGHAGPVAVACGMFGGISMGNGRHGGVVGAEDASLVTITVPRLDAKEREALWREAIGERGGCDFRAIGERLRLPAGYIRRAGRLAVAQAEMAGRATVSPDDVRAAVRLLGREALETLAVRIDSTASWSDLVVSPPVYSRLREVQGRCFHRERISDALGPAFRSHPSRGVKALFSGPSGTGKTLAAKILASELGMDLYQIDLSAVVNKYIGETEKNLHRALTAAEELDVLLLLDEGDALLARRSEVKGANDRYANLETNFLLQRLEAYEGIVVITTNAADNIDPAFQRRMDAVIPFASPGPEERLAIWQLHLPSDHAVAPALLERVALRCALNGGQIRSAAQHAALLALEERGPITSDRLEAAVRAEYRKNGGLCPLDGESERSNRERSPAAFMGAVSKGGGRHGQRCRQQEASKRR